MSYKTAIDEDQFPCNQLGEIDEIEKAMEIIHADLGVVYGSKNEEDAAPIAFDPNDAKEVEKTLPPPQPLDSSRKRTISESKESSSEVGLNFLDFFDQYIPKKSKVDDDLEFTILKSLVTVPTTTTTNQESCTTNRIKLAPQIHLFAANVARTRSWLSVTHEQWCNWKEYVDNLLTAYTIKELKSLMYFKILHSAISSNILLPWNMLGTIDVPQIEFECWKNSPAAGEMQYYNNSTVQFIVTNVIIKRNPYSKHQTNIITFNDIDRIGKVKLILEGHSHNPEHYNGFEIDDEVFIGLFSSQNKNIPLYVCDSVGGELREETVDSKEMVDKSFSGAVLTVFRVNLGRTGKCFLDLKLNALYKFGKD